MREAFWISVAVHLAVVMFLFFTPKIFPGIKGVVLISPEDLMRNQQMTYLDLPPDMQKAPKVAPKTDVLSDKNRIAESRHPTLDKKTLEELKRAGPPKLPSPPAAATGSGSAATGAAGTATAAEPGPADGAAAECDSAGQSSPANSAARHAEIFSSHDVFARRAVERRLARLPQGEPVAALVVAVSTAPVQVVRR